MYPRAECFICERAGSRPGSRRCRNNRLLELALTPGNTSRKTWHPPAVIAGSVIGESGHLSFSNEVFSTHRHLLKSIHRDCKLS